jgi:cell division protease FtsH
VSSLLPRGIPTSQPEPPYRRLLRGPLVYVLIILGGLWIFVSFAMRGPQAQTLSVPAYERAIAAGHVETATFLESDQKVQGKLDEGTEYEVPYPIDAQQGLIRALQSAGVNFTADPQKGSAVLAVLLQTILPIVLIAGVLIFVMNQSQGGGRGVMSFGKSRHKVVAKDQPKTTFEDIAGVEEAVEELQEVKEY